MNPESEFLWISGYVHWTANSFHNNFQFTLRCEVHEQQLRMDASRNKNGSARKLNCPTQDEASFIDYSYSGDVLYAEASAIGRQYKPRPFTGRLFRKLVRWCMIDFRSDLLGEIRNYSTVISKPMDRTLVDFCSHHAFFMTYYYQRNTQYHA